MDEWFHVFGRILKAFADVPGSLDHHGCETTSEDPGTLFIAFEMPRAVSRSVGAIGVCDIPLGFYGCRGSAFGAGGIHARVAGISMGQSPCIGILSISKPMVTYSMCEHSRGWLRMQFH